MKTGRRGFFGLLGAAAAAGAVAGNAEPKPIKPPIAPRPAAIEPSFDGFSVTSSGAASIGVFAWSELREVKA